METVPFYVYTVFGITVALTLFLFFRATNYSKTAILTVFGWLLLQSAIGLTGFYTDTFTLPPRFALALVPALLCILFLFVVKKGRSFIDRLDLKILTFFHVIRIPVELVLFWLFMHKGMPELATFEGRNYDILSGITAPFVWYFGFVKKKLGKGWLLAWNFACLALLLNIVIHAVLSVPTPFQQIAFDQPAIAVLYFPFILLPVVIVPLVLFAHLVSIRQLLRRESPVTSIPA